MAISKRLANALGGDIEIRSELGKGSTFTLTIDVGPRQDAPMRQALPAAAMEGAKGLPGELEPDPGCRLLLAEDDADIRRIVCLLLRKMHLDVAVAENGQVACAMAEQSRAEGRPYDLILMDIQMPQMNGYEATRRLRQQGWQGPIVALTAHAMMSDREKCLAAGCDDYLAKPITATALRDAMSRFLHQTQPG